MVEIMLLENLAYARNYCIDAIKSSGHYSLMNIHQRIKARRLELQMSMQELAEKVGVSSWQTVQQWEKDGGTAPKRERLDAVATALKVSKEWLSFGQGEPATKQSENLKAGPEIKGQLPLISWVRAGDLCESPDNFHPGDAEEWIDCPVPHSNRAYCLRVAGDSMDGEGGYRDGEIIFVDPDVAATPGRDVVVRTPDGKTTFKRLKEDTEGPYLLALNGKKIIRIPPDAHICGVVIFSGFKR
jgi:SOS-response transcriptional repressor LexA